MIENKLELLKLTKQSRLIEGFGTRIESSLVLRLISELLVEENVDLSSLSENDLIQIFKKHQINADLKEIEELLQHLRSPTYNKCDLSVELLDKISSSFIAFYTQEKTRSLSFFNVILFCLFIAACIIYYVGDKLIHPAVAKVTYFSNKSLEGAPFGTFFEPLPDVDFGMDGPKKGMPTDNFSIRYESILVAKSEGIYNLSVLSDDGVRVYIDDALVLDFWVPQDSITHKKSIPLSKGEHRLRIEYFEGLVGAKLHFKVTDPEGNSPTFKTPE